MIFVRRLYLIIHRSFCSDCELEESEWSARSDERKGKTSIVYVVCSDVLLTFLYIVTYSFLQDAYDLLSAYNIPFDRDDFDFCSQLSGKWSLLISDAVELENRLAPIKESFTEVCLLRYLMFLIPFSSLLLFFSSEIGSVLLIEFLIVFVFIFLFSFMLFLVCFFCHLFHLNRVSALDFFPPCFSLPLSHFFFPSLSLFHSF